MSLSHFIFSGTSYEQGLAHGEELKDSIEKNIDVYLNRFETEAGSIPAKLARPLKCNQEYNRTDPNQAASSRMNFKGKC